MIADTVQFLGSREGGGEPQYVPAAATAQAGADADFGAAADDDIPF